MQLALWEYGLASTKEIICRAPISGVGAGNALTIPFELCLIIADFAEVL